MTSFVFQCLSARACSMMVRLKNIDMLVAYYASQSSPSGSEEERDSAAFAFCRQPPSAAAHATGAAFVVVVVVCSAPPLRGRISRLSPASALAPTTRMRHPSTGRRWAGGPE